MTRRCGWCSGEFRIEQTREIYTRTSLSGPERPVFACEGCIRKHGLLPRAGATTAPTAAFIGRVTLPPAIAAHEQPPHAG